MVVTESRGRCERGTDLCVKNFPEPSFQKGRRIGIFILLLLRRTMGFRAVPSRKERVGTLQPQNITEAQGGPCIRRVNFNK